MLLSRQSEELAGAAGEATAAKGDSVVWVRSGGKQVALGTVIGVITQVGAFIVKCVINQLVFVIKVVTAVVRAVVPALRPLSGRRVPVLI